jgi:peptide-methionine (S)-S-oxide reductase
MFSCNTQNHLSYNQTPKESQDMNIQEHVETAIFAGGCFWCTEAIFLEVKGIIKIVPGYIGGHTENPTYKEVCTGKTGHAEAIRIIYNPEEVGYAKLLEVFFATHDPTTLNRQGNDIGTQYRSEIFYMNESQREVAQKYIKLLEQEKVFEDKIITKITNATDFYKAEDYHHNYYNLNKTQSYCEFVISPKIEKVKKMLE